VIKSKPLASPFPYFGGKRKASSLIWERFGDVQNYVEPFFGSGAVLLGRPSPFRGTETVNDKDCYLANFWRALRADPDGVSFAADWPVNEADLHARHLWLLSQAEFRERMRTEPDYYDPLIAGVLAAVTRPAARL
jgi:DNA adenine methylase